MAEKNMDAKISVDFEESASRQQLNSGESVVTLFGKIKKFFTDLKAVAFSGSYDDLSDTPESLPANGGNADTVGRLPASNFAYMTDIIRGVKYGWVCNTAGIVMTYGDREIIKTTANLSYIGWTINSDNWFVPIIVSQQSSGTNYTMFNNSCGYDLLGPGGDGASFVYKSRTYYACWASPSSYQNPTVSGGLRLTVTDSDYISACKRLIDNCEGIDSVNADTADTARQVISTNAKAKLYEDGEGGNLRLTSPDGEHYVEMDIFNGQDFRMYFGDDSTGDLMFPFYFHFATGKISINGDTDFYSPNNKPYVTGILSEQANDLPVTLTFNIFDFTPSKVICQFGSGSAFFANVVTNGFSLAIPAGTTTIHYIAFK